MHKLEWAVVGSALVAMSCSVEITVTAGTDGGAGASGTSTGGSSGASGAAGSSGKGGTSTGGDSGSGGAMGGSGGAMGGSGGATGGSGGSGGSMGGTPSGDTCLHVAPNGDDSAAASAMGASPFASVQAAVDFAVTHAGAPRSVCIAAGPSCGAEFAYSGGRGDLFLTESISLFGKYESSTFARCTDSVTRLEPTHPSGVWLEDVVDGVTLDGIAVRSAEASTASALVVVTSNDVVLRDLSLDDTNSVNATGLSLHDSTVEMVDSRITLTSGDVETVGIAVHDTKLTLSTSSIDVSSPGVSRAIFFDWGRGSRVLDSTLRVAGGSVNASATGIVVYGFADAIQVAGNSISVLGAAPDGVGVFLDDCSITNPELIDNFVLVEGSLAPGRRSNATGIHSQGFCGTRVQDNIVRAYARNGGVATGIRCSVGGCEVLDNNVAVGILAALPNTVNRGTGIDCSDCREISGNTATGILAVAPCGGTCDFNSIAISAVGNGTLVDSNHVNGGCSGGLTGGEGSTGIRASGTIRIQNNLVSGGHECLSSPVGAAMTSGVLVAGGEVDVHSNFIDGGRPSTPICMSAAVRFLGANRAVVRNNILLAGSCLHFGEPVSVWHPDFYPQRLENNDLQPNALGVLYHDFDQQGRYFTVQDLAAITAFPFVGSFTASCTLPLAADSPCRDAGVTAGAPAFDYEGDARTDGRPDVGPDERVPLQFTQVSAGQRHTCGLLSNGTLRCWGDHDCFLGLDPTSGETFLAVSAGFSHTCAIRTDETLACWGEVSNHPNDAILPTVPAGRFELVRAGGGHACAIRTDGTLACWGVQSSAVAPPPGAFTDVGVGDSHSCGLRGDGKILCWGSNDWGESAPPPGNFVDLSANAQHACGVRTDGTITCWGRLNLQDMVPPPPGAFISVESGWANYQCGMRPAGTIECWGSNSVGQTSPPPGVFTSFSSGFAHSCAIRPDRSLACWGRNDRGQSASL